MCALRGSIERVDRLTPAYEQPIATWPDEAEIRAPLRHHDLAEARAVRRVAMDAVDALAPERGRGPDIAVAITADAVVEPGIDFDEDPPIGEPPTVVLQVPGQDACLLARMDGGSARYRQRRASGNPARTQCRSA